MVGNYWQLLTAITGREVIGSYVPFEKRAWNSLGRWATRKEAAAVAGPRDVAGVEESLHRVANRFA